MSVFSFDLVNQINVSEINNVYDQVKREIGFRYDFKGTPANIEWLDADKGGLIITGNSDMQIDSITEIIRKKLSSRGLSQKLLNVSQEPVKNNFQISKNIPFKKGLDQETLKKISKEIRDKLPKVKSTIQGDSLRISSNSKDELQKTMQIIRAMELDFPIQFINFK